MGVVSAVKNLGAVASPNGKTSTENLCCATHNIKTLMTPSNRNI